MRRSRGPGAVAAGVAAAIWPLAVAAAVNLDALWDFGQPQQSERRFRQALGRAVGDDALVLRTQIARSLGLQKRFEAAHRELDDLERPALDAAAEVRVRLWLERGRVHRSSGRPDLGLPWFRVAFDLAEAEALQDLAGDALHMVALALPPGDEQMATHRRTVGYARSASDPKARRWEGAALNNLGDAERNAGRLEAALATFRESRAAYERQRSPGGERIARWQVANVLRLMGRVDEALAMQQQLETEHERGGGSDACCTRPAASRRSPGAIANAPRPFEPAADTRGGYPRVGERMRYEAASSSVYSACGPDCSACPRNCAGCLR
jgi:tetratricopeptide (TPR) repeat protein